MVVEYFNSYIDTTTFNDTVLIFTFDSQSDMWAIVSKYNGQPVPFNLNNHLVAAYDDHIIKWQTQNVYIQFDKFPLPIVDYIIRTTSPLNQNCRWNETLSRFDKCLPGGSAFYLRGSYLYQPIKVFIGDQECFEDIYEKSSLSFQIPLFAFVPFQFYDLVIETPAGRTILANYFSFDSIPVISFIEPCAISYQSSGYFRPLKCLADEILTMAVYNFNTNIIPRIEIKNNNNGASVDCQQTRYVNSNMITCTLPPITFSRNLLGTITAIWPNNTRSTEYPTVNVYDLPDSPRILSMSGCYNTAKNGIRLNQC